MSEIDKSMRLNAPKGQKVIFKGLRDGLWGGGHADGQLKEGSIYTVESTKVFGSHSLVILKEFPEEEFNTVMFEEEGERLEATQTSEELFRQGVAERNRT